MSAKPIFIVSSGRSGTTMMTKALRNAEDVTIECEYMVNIIQPLAVRRYQGLIGPDIVRATLEMTHGAALRYNKGRLWGDCSHNLSWLIPDLAATFPEARFIHLVRDGRDVATSYFYNLFVESYDDRSTRLMAAHLASPYVVPAPPPEKKYWWPQPKANDPRAGEFPRFGRFQRIAWHWAEINRVIARDLAGISENRKLFLRLEDLQSHPSLVSRMFRFLDLPYRDECFAAFSRPHNGNHTLDNMLTPEQAVEFARIASPMLEQLGYAACPEYQLNFW